MPDKPDHVPHSVAHALRRALGPNEELEELVRVYGHARGHGEYASRLRVRGVTPEQQILQRLKDEELLREARVIAAENGWAWEDVVALTRRMFGVDQNWRTADWYVRRGEPQP